MFYLTLVNKKTSLSLLVGTTVMCRIHVSMPPGYILILKKMKVTPVHRFVENISIDMNIL